MAKRSNNNSAGRRVYGEKPYDANNSFVKKMATKVTDLMPQRSWISKWFNAPGGNGEVSNEGDNPDEQDMEEETLQPPSKRPRIRMDMTHPPGTFNIQTRERGVNEKLEYTSEQYPLPDDSINDFLQPSIAARNNVGRAFISSTPAIHASARNSNSPRSDLDSLNHQQQQQQNNVATNGADDNSESSESTSGCSSLIPQTNRQESMSTYINYPFAMRKGLSIDKMSYTNHLQSPRSLLFDGRDSASSRRPSFNYSIVSNGNNSVLSSPFYSGNTTFGGANAIANFRSGHANSGDGNDFQLRVPKRASIRVKPSNSSATADSSGMSQTAKRILEALEHFSSPISDAKKIPIKTSLNTVSSGRKRPREEDLPAVSQVGLRHLTRELSVPTVPDMLKLRRRQRLQDTTLAARRIVSAQNEPPPPNVTLSTNSTEYHLRTESDNKKFFGKLRTNAKKKVDVEEPAETVNLSNIPLPITTMPSFNILLPVSQNKSSNETIQNTKSSPFKESTAFKFSSPVKLIEATKNLESTHSFKFSEPINAEKERPKISFKIKSKRSGNVNSNLTPVSSSPATNFMWSGSSTAPRPKEKKTEVKKKEETEGVNVASELKSGSVMDILGKKSVKSANIWECSECMIKNNDSNDQCIACKAPKSNSTKKVSPVSNFTSPIGGNEGQFGAQFKMSNDKWECSSCLVRNPVTEIKCLSCMTPKQKNKNDSESLSLVAGKISSSDAKDTIKSSESTWECPGCMLKNAVNVITCPCCNASKPGLIKTNSKPLSKSKSIKSKSSAKTWECPSCMVKNNSTASTCVCCTTPCPGNNSSSKKATESTSSAPVTSGFGDQFKKPAGMWTCDTCMIQNKADATKCAACESLKSGTLADASIKKSSGNSSSPFKFGMPSAFSQFQFGIPKTEEKKTNNPTNGFTFGAPNTQSSTQSFTFGVPKTESSQGTSGFTFTASKSSEGGLTTFKSESEQKSSQSSTNLPPSQGFTFGVSKKEEKKSEQSGNEPEKKSPTLIFGTPKSENSGEKPAQAIVFSNPTTLNVGNNPTKPIVNQQITSTEAKKPAVFSFVPPGSVAGSAGNNTETSSTSSSVSQVSFTFSEPKMSKSATPERPAINFGQASTTTASATSASSGFSFTSPKFTEINQAGPPEKKPALNFGSNPIPATAPPAYGLATSAATSEKNLGDKPISSPFEILNKQDKNQGFSIEKKPPAYGAESKPPEAPASAPVFGSSEKSGFIGTGAPAFGAAPASAPAPPMFGSGTSLFGNNSSSGFGTSTSSTTSNIFSSVKPTETPAINNTPGLFSFGTTPSQPPPQQNTSGGFNFNMNSPAPKYPFVFGNNSAAPTQPTPGTGFGAPNFGAASASNPAPPPFSFNAPKSDGHAVFGQTLTQLPNIFSNNEATGTLGQPTPASSFTSSTPGSIEYFSFRTPTFGTGSSTASASSGFNSNAGVTPATSSGGFNFNPVSSPAINFDPNTKPTFNFTGGSAPTAFNAQPQPPRKIKKAVRRMPTRTT